MKVYKALAQTRDGLVSSGVEGPYAQLYTPGECKQCPNMFVFAELKHALAYAKSSQVWEAETPEVRYAPQYILHSTDVDYYNFRRFWFWKRPTPKRLLDEAPEGSYLCDELRIIKRVK